MQIDPATLGTLDLEDMWVPYIDLNDGSFLPTRLQIAADEYAFQNSMIILGHGAVLPGRIRALRESGKKTVIVERSARYYVFASPP